MDIENLVFEGGGAKGVAFCGSIKFLEEKNIMKNIKRIIGSSAGAITATVLAIGYNSNEIEKILNDTNFSNFKDDTYGVLVDIYRFFDSYGIYKGDVFKKWISKIIKKKTGNKNITFREIYDLYEKELVITGTNLTKQITDYFNYKDYPDMKVKDAVRISISLPMFFKSVIYNNNYYVDGGVLNNYPIWYFDNYENTLGFKLVGNNEKRDNMIYHVTNSINNISDYIMALLNSMSCQIERLYITPEYWERTITINTHDISTTEFDLSLEKKKILIKEGYNSTAQFFNQKNVNY